MQQTFEDIRKDFSNIYSYLTTNRYLIFFKDERNRPNSAVTIELAERLKISMQRTRKLVTECSNAMEDTEVCQRNLWLALSKEKPPRKKRERKE